MMEIASKPEQLMLRVAVTRIEQPVQRELRFKLARLGHAMVDADEHPDIVIFTDAKRRGSGKAMLFLRRAASDVVSSLPLNASVDQLGAALSAIIAGLIVHPDDGHIDGFRQLEEAEGEHLLTPRELEVLHAISRGLQNKAIARDLDVSLHTVKFHIESVYRKLGARNRTEAIAIARKRSRDQVFDL
jgi:DNA-binding CsgD family transcriptional regulator